ncbi:MAG: hypothetical protein HFI10_06860 [Lachnospiraceae bacterium]|nr:hypothetical protein [Lachnospiraceae bacterium]
MKALSKRYFQDYEMQENFGKDGNIKRELIYIGNTYSAAMPEKRWRRKKAVFAVLSICCIVLFLAANLQDTRSNIVGILPAFGVIVVIPLFVLCCGCICGIRKKQTMTRAEFVEYSMMIRFGGFLTTVLGCLNFLWHGKFLMRDALPGGLGKEAAVIVMWLLLTLLGGFLWIAEMRTEYIVRNRYGTVLHQEHLRRKDGQV